MVLMTTETCAAISHDPVSHQFAINPTDMAKTRNWIGARMP
jgi:hypothetical protein